VPCAGRRWRMQPQRRAGSGRPAPLPPTLVERSAGVEPQRGLLGLPSSPSFLPLTPLREPAGLETRLAPNTAAPPPLPGSENIRIAYLDVIPPGKSEVSTAALGRGGRGPTHGPGTTSCPQGPCATPRPQPRHPASPGDAPARTRMIRPPSPRLGPSRKVHFKLLVPLEQFEQGQPRLRGFKATGFPGGNVSGPPEGRRQRARGGRCSQRGCKRQAPARRIRWPPLPPASFISNWSPCARARARQPLPPAPAAHPALTAPTPTPRTCSCPRAAPAPWTRSRRRTARSWATATTWSWRPRSDRGPS
jgi:hypothetical protein